MVNYAGGSSWTGCGCYVSMARHRGGIIKQCSDRVCTVMAPTWLTPCWCCSAVCFNTPPPFTRHLQRNPDNQLYPLFEYFENWCQDENRHGDFFTAILKVSSPGGGDRGAPMGRVVRGVGARGQGARGWIKGVVGQCGTGG